MKEYIERETCLKESKKYIKCIIAELYELDERLDEIPVADVALVIHGEWKYYTIGVTSYRECSVCGENNPSGFKTPYCPWCGAKMDGGKE